MNEGGAAILAALRKRDQRAFAARVSGQGLVVANHYTDSMRLATIVKDTEYGLPLKGLRGLDYEERVAVVPRADVARPVFGRTFDYLAAVVKDADEYQHLAATDHATLPGDGKRPCGPAIVGKGASDVHWALYLRAEAGAWRVWRVEEYCRP